MKKILSVIIAVLILATITPTTAYAKESAMDLYKRDRDAFYKKYMCLDEEAEEQGLYSDANNGAFVKNKSNKKDSKTTNSSSYAGNGYTGEARGWVYSTDELHIIGLPENPETGYTQAGNYGTIYP